MMPFEWVAIAYFPMVAITGWQSEHRVRGLLYAMLAATLVIVARFTLGWEARAWLAHAYLVLGYWIPAVFTPVPAHDRFERWLARADARIEHWALGVEHSTLGDRHARANHHLFELSYLLCYPLVPAAFTVVFLRGAREDVTWFWLAVLAAGYACYGTLPWTAARPPRSIARDEHARRGLAKLNTWVLGRLSHNLNTFPSGHVAVSLAAAAGAWRVSPVAGVVFGAMGIAIAVAAVAGRYHYLVDVLLGMAVGVAALAIASAI